VISPLAWIAEIKLIHRSSRIDSSINPEAFGGKIPFPE